MNRNETLNDNPVLVKNPYTGKKLNMQLFFDYFHLNCEDNPEELFKVLDETIKFIVCHTEPDDTRIYEQQTMLQNLFKVRDSLGRMKEIV